MVISPWSKVLRDGRQSPKSYPWWPDVVHQLRYELDVKVTQVGISGEPLIGAWSLATDFTVPELAGLLKACDCWISVDNFWHHMAAYYKVPGVVIFSKSDPRIFGHSQNTNLFLDKSWLRPNQFGTWEDDQHEQESFVRPHVVVKAVGEILRLKAEAQ